MIKPFAPAAERNAGAIVDVLRLEFANCRTVFEIGSGSGQHAVYFARQLSWLTWQPSDVADRVAGIRDWVSEAGLPNVLDPQAVDVTTAGCLAGRFDAAFSANTAHIMHIDAVASMFKVVAGGLSPGGAFVLYGPFRQGGRYNTESNAVFDRSLRQRDPGMGLRDMEFLDELARQAFMERARLYAMPANNHIAVWVKSGAAT